MFALHSSSAPPILRTYLLKIIFKILAVPVVINYWITNNPKAGVPMFKTFVRRSRHVSTDGMRTELEPELAPMSTP